MSPSSIPDTIPAIPLPRQLSGLVWTREELGRLDDTRSPQTLDQAATDWLLPGTPVELEQDAFVVLGNRIGEGRQGIVYSVTTCDDACVKVCRNDIAAKQFRRERLGIRHFDELGVCFPAVLAGDSLGRWIVKERWRSAETGELLLEARQRRLPPLAILSLKEYVQKVEKAGLCADWMPSNVVFRPNGCASFETVVWPVEHYGWSFATCFIPVWLPHGVIASSLGGFPPYDWRSGIDVARRAWECDPGYETWRELFGDFPTLCRDWWIT